MTSSPGAVVASSPLPATLNLVRLRVLFAVVAVFTVSCTDGDTDESDVSDPDLAPERSITVPPERSTPFCQAMIELDEALPADPSIDASERILDAYRDALPDVPAEIAVQFAAVIEALERGTEATLPPTTPSADDIASTPTTSPASTISSPANADDPVPSATENTFDEEGYLPDESPAAQVNAYIDFACRDTVNNPGPPPTEPDVSIVTDTTDT